MSSWQPLKINEHVWIVKFKSENEKLSCFLSDFKSVFSEEVNFKEVFNRAKEQNPFVDQEPENILQMIMSPSSISIMENNILSFKYNEGVPFKFSWNLSKNSDEVFFEQITTSLINSLAIMKDQNKELKTVIQSKDAEIEQYKLEGVTIVRKNLETKVFNEKEFDEKFQDMKKCDFVEFVNADENRASINLVCGINLSEDGCVPKKTPIKESTKISKRETVKQRLLSRKFQSTNDAKLIVYDEDEQHSQPNETSSEPEILSPTPKKIPKIRRDLNL